MLQVGKTDIENTIISTIRQSDSTNGLSINEIQQHLPSSLKNDLDLQSIQSCLDCAVKKGSLLKLSTGKYAINTGAVSKDKNTSEKHTEVAQDADVNLDPDQRKEFAPSFKKGASVSTAEKGGSIPEAQADANVSTAEKGGNMHEAQEDSNVLTAKKGENALETQKEANISTVENGESVLETKEDADVSTVKDGGSLVAEESSSSDLYYGEESDSDDDSDDYSSESDDNEYDSEDSDDNDDSLYNNYLAK